MNGKTYLPQAPRITLMPLWLILFFGTTVLAPAIGLWKLTDRFENSIAAIKEAECQEKSRELLMRVRISLDRNVVITEALGKFRRAVIKDCKNLTLTPEKIDFYNKRLHQVFPSDTQTYWFDENDQLISVPPPSPQRLTTAKRVWKAFLRSLHNETTLSATERALVEGFIKNSFGQIATLKYLKHCRTQATEVIINGRLYSIAALKFNSTSRPKKRIGSCIVIAPLYRARKDWELIRTAKLYSGENTAVGGMRQSTNNKILEMSAAPEPLSPALLHGLLVNLERGQSVYKTTDWYIYSQLYEKDADLMLTVAVHMPGISRTAAIGIVSARFCLILGTFALGIAFLALGGGLWHPRVSLRVKFSAAAAALTVPPLLAMCLLGLEHLNRVARDHIERCANKLENNLAELEQNIANEFGKIETELIFLARNSTLQTVASTQDLESCLAPFKDKGLKRAMLSFLDGRFF